ncbi:BZ3500_MvSof-1268-A1-R1_Chr3-3g06622 [Microbotryum saponariae]|uniref:BZ3500_MvSof-1268-A1-R1_Chr3-3g06622 protein n=1 Tax=Microbotryum saponariae TaxID=289078 RepID=A0A2X0KVD8_9BASI|nr:BZ3500_MvSof-1268-A1-R1_Chr3-3g06622 [Microbotryum saponariae]SDA04589.1 BZ3501_MvSof-1269-A2-R1_Chr3-2g06309 [Microbotryum saponariae]
MRLGLGRVLLELLKAWFPNRDPSSKAPPAFEGLLVVHVEMDTEHGQAHQEQKPSTEDLKTLVDSIGIKDVEFMSLLLSEIFNDPSTPESTSQTAVERHQKLVRLLHPTPSPTPSKTKIDHTSLASLQRSLLLTLLRRKAREEKCEVLVTGEGSDRVAELTIEGMALGRGYAIGEEVGVEWEVSEGEKAQGNGLLVARPVSGILRAEMDELVRVKRLVVARPDRGEAAGGGPTIQAVVAKFVNGLQKEFPSTVQTVLATVHKLGMRSTDARMRIEEGEMGSESWKGCAICGGPVQEGAHRWRTAITMSDLFETDPASVTRSIEDAEPQTAAIGISESKHDDSANSLDSSLCYGCLSIPKAIAKPEDLPSYVEQQRWSSGRMDDVVKEFLIEE